MKRLILTLALAATALAAAACSSSAPTPTPSATPGTGAPSGDPGATPAPVVAAEGLKFDTAELVVPAGAAFSLQFDNREGPPHNVAIYSDASAGSPLFVGEIFSGPATKTYSVPAIAPGSYFFRCDVHPDMKGTLVAQ